MNYISGENIERKICENEIETCEASNSCTGNTDDNDGTTETEGPNTSDGGTEIDDGKCWKEYIGFHVRGAPAPSPFGGQYFSSLDEGQVFCKETILKNRFSLNVVPFF